ncbi:unnamed protein product [Rotaria sordida]|uniref:Uncharacterized protein n=1 Tax=Rotaria sordida TaxID=392033 RepID=A0A815FDU6_9BILA|nr:unnamed protein product [Rotaria sordida]CAF1586335.1 unnamed protein product [Rotaria sordida]
MIILICKSKQEDQHIIHTLFAERDKNDIFYYGFVDIDKYEYNIINTLKVDDVGDPHKRKYPILPSAYDPSNDIVFMSAINNQNKIVLSAINATAGILLHTFDSIPNEIISLQYDILNKKLFAHTETDDKNLTQIVEIDTNTGNFIDIL